MATGNIYITGIIGEDTTELDVIRQVKSLPDNIEEIIVNINNSNGGNIDEGFAILNYLKSLGKKITTKGRGNVDSISTVLMQAGKGSGGRYLEEKTESFVIHNANIDPAALGSSVDSNKLKAIAEFLKDEENKITTFYTENTSLDFKTLDRLMDKETNLSPDDAKKFGFIDDTFSDLKAAALFISNTKINNKMDEGKEEAVGLLERLLKLFKGGGGEEAAPEETEAKNMLLTLEDGKGIFVFSEDGELEGKKAVLADAEGEPTDAPAPDGEHILRDKRKITIEGGTVTSVTEDATEEPENDNAMKEEFESFRNESNAKLESLSTELKNLSESLKGMVENSKKEKEEVEGFRSEARGYLKKLSTNFAIPTAANNFSETGGAEKSLSDQIKGLPDPQTV